MRLGVAVHKTRQGILLETGMKLLNVRHNSAHKCMIYDSNHVILLNQNMCSFN